MDYPSGQKKWRLSKVAVSGGSVRFSLLFYLKDVQKNKKILIFWKADGDEAERKPPGL